MVRVRVRARARVRVRVSTLVSLGVGVISIVGRMTAGLRAMDVLKLQ